MDHGAGPSVVQAWAPIPLDVAVVACDDDPLIGEMPSPTITGLLYSAERIVLPAAEVMDGIMNGAPAPAEPVAVPLPRILHVRESSDASKQANTLRVLAGLSDAAVVNADILAAKPMAGLSPFYACYVLEARTLAGILGLMRG